MKELPKKYNASEAEQTWGQHWEDTAVYKWDESKSRAETFVVDTPPPTVSGSLHLGHVFSYTQTDIVARYQRMTGKTVFYPMGWDDNGLPTERRVQNYFGIKCNPQIKYEENWTPNHDFNPKKDQIKEVSRKNFVEACDELVKIDEKAFENMWRRLALSVEWKQTYATIDKHSQKISQVSFLDLAKKEQVYSSKSPTMWDIDFQSAIAQAEVEDRDRPGAYHDVKFAIEGGGDFIISTTRPELLPACIAVVAHPEDERYKEHFGKNAITPLFHAKVPICPSEFADPEKGSGIMMICTFGDITDVDWWKQSDLAIKQIIGKDGRIIDIEYGEEPFTSLSPEIAAKNYAELKGLNIKQAQKRIVELLQEPDSYVNGKEAALQAEPKPISHPVKFFEKGDRPLEFIPTRQWFIKTLEHKEALIEQGRKIKWHPEHMRVRYENWVEGLNQDWCISRQRFFGVPFPVWYKLNADGEVNYQDPIYAEEENLPIDPQVDLPKGFTEEQRGKPDGFVGDPDVMDTWATSCVSPQISSHWSIDEERHSKLFPADIRPQAHEIIRTWAFGTIVKAWMHHDSVPWHDVLISGWVLDPDRKKMSKSKGNVVTPENLFDQYSADAIRYWAARARLGADTAVDESVFKIGGKLITKLFNASKFVLMQFERINLDPNDTNPADITEQLDRSLVANLKDLSEETKKNFDNYEHAGALQLAEDAFWDFCDNYLELVKVRSYTDEDNEARKSALATLAWSLKTFIRLFAPFLPYVTEEVWQAAFAKDKNDSVHVASWPNPAEVSTVEAPASESAYNAAVEVISKIRGYKTNAQKSLKWEISELKLTCNEDSKQALDSVLSDVLLAGNVNSDGVAFTEGESEDGNFEIAITLNEDWTPEKRA